MKIVHIQQEQLPERIPIADSFAGDGYRQGPGGQLPDVDIDFQSDRRQEVKEYLERRYNTDGRQRVFSAGTLTTLKMKAVLKDVSRMHRVPVGVVNYITAIFGDDNMTWTDLFKLAAKHQNSVFHLFTNGTLIDQAFCDRVKEVGNMAFFISIEGIGDATDDRRGEGVYDRVMHAMDLMKENGLLFGTSICYTSANYKAVTSDEFMDMLISHGVRFNWYFHYMPIGDGANVDLMLNAEQREYMIHRVREIRGFTGGKPIFCIDFQNDGEYIDGCIAGGRQYAHINPAGDVEPCVFIHYSNANIHDKSLLECLQQPLFKEYHKGQPFNNNHLRPCPMLENPELLGEMVKRSGAHSTDMQQPESTDDVFRRCRPYADQWTPSAERIWEEEHPGCTSCASCSGCASK